MNPIACDCDPLLMKTFHNSCQILLGLLFAGASLAAASGASYVRDMGRGVNLGNLLEAPSEGEWGVTLEKEDLHRVASLDFRHVRLPVRWDGKGTLSEPGFDRVARTVPYTVDPRFFARVDSAIAWARANRLMVVLNDHHHESLFENCAAERPRFLAIWKQVAEHYRNLPDSVAFEILNEPHGTVTAEAWNDLLDTALKIIRQSNPTRTVVIGGPEWSGVSGLSALRLPSGDTNLILTVHDYDPMTFTHQGADWIRPTPPSGVAWKGTRYEKLAARQAAETVRDYSRIHQIPVWMGEFGAYEMADSVSRARWAEYHARLYESMGFSWAWWELKAGFGIWDRGTRSWNRYLTKALLSNDTSCLRLPSAPSGGVDLVENGNFASGARWSFNGSSRAELSFDGGAASILVRQKGANTWDVQLLQFPLALRKGIDYALLFDAWSDHPRSIGASLGMSGAPWAPYASTVAALGTVRRTYVASFQAGFEDPQARVAFDLGGDTGIVHIADVRLMAFDSTLARREAFRP